jgi:hypothetical protein
MGLHDKIDRDKLDRHKKDLEVRKRGRSIEDTWTRLDGDDNLSTKEKLQRLIDLRIAGKEKKETPRTRPDWEPEPREPLQYFENAYSLDTRYGKAVIGEGLKIDGETLYYLSRNEEFQGLGLNTALFLDLETTGLAGGTGTTAFLVGLGYYRSDKFVVAQYFLGDPGEEERMLRDLDRLFEEGGFRSVVTYNGKAFDIPLLETRFILKRQKLRLVDWPHFDFLFSARSLWKHKHESCRLFHLAREVVAADRSEDIPGAEIPARYFDYLRTGDFSRIEPILYHNQEDILSLLGLVIVGARLFKGEKAEDRTSDEAAEMDALDLVGVGRLFETAGDLGRSIAIFERAIDVGLPSGMEIILKEKISYHFKRAKDWDKAVPLWKDLSEMEWTVLAGREVKGILNSLRQLAIHHERHTKDLPEALRVAEEGMALAMRVAAPLLGDFRKRVNRLQGKIGPD